MDKIRHNIPEFQDMQTLSNFFKTTREAIFIHDYDSGRIIDVNDLMLEMYGYSQDEILNIDMEKISSGKAPHTVEEACELLQRVKKEGEINFEWHDRKKNGKFFWTDNTMKVILLNGQKRILVLSRDITARKKKQLQLQSMVRESIEKIHSLNEKLTLANEELKITNEELSAYKDQLEELVAIRTQELRKSEESLKYKSKLEQLMTVISTRFLNLTPDLVDENIVNALHEICSFIGADMGFLAEIMEEKDFFSITHAWKNEHITYDEKYFEKAPLNDLSKWFDEIKDKDYILISSQHDLPPDPYIRSVFQHSGAATMIFIPITYQRKWERFIVFSSFKPEREWNQDEISLFKVISEMFVSALKRKKSEQILIENEEKFRLIVQFLTDIIWIIDKKTNILYESPSSYKILGYEPGFLIGKKGMDMVHPEDLNLVNRDLEEVFRKQNDFIPTIFRIKHANGSWVLLEVIANNMLDHPAIKGIIITGRDITERKQVEKALKISEAKFRNIFNNSIDAIVIVASNYRFLEVNDVFLKITGYSLEETKNMKLTDIITDNYLPMMVERFKRYFHLENIPALECEIKCKSRSTYPAEINSKLIEFEGKQAIVSVIRNITERKLIEKRILDTIINTEERERKKFARNLHDELGPLLSSIKMYVNSLYSTTDKQKHDFVISQLKEILTEAIQSTKELSNDLSPHVLTNYGLLAALEWFINQIKPYIKIIFETNLKEERYSNTLESSIYRIIKELINNTIKHARAKTITIKLHRILRSIHLIYSDDGIGFPDEWLDNNEFMGMGMSNILNRSRSINATSKFFNHVPNGMSFEMEVPVE
jgi:PAS domain S-box-containing protein